VRRIREAANLPYEEARESLTKFVGVGDKVADCVLLFSLGFLEAVPLDTWIRTTIEEYYPDCERGNYTDTSRAIREQFGGEFRYAQTYVFTTSARGGSSPARVGFARGSVISTARPLGRTFMPVGVVLGLMMDCRVVEAAVPVYDVETADEAIRIAISKTGEMLNPDLNYVEIETGNRTSPGGEELLPAFVAADEALVALQLRMDVFNVDREETRAASPAKRSVSGFGTFRWRCFASSRRSRATPAKQSSTDSAEDGDSGTQRRDRLRWRLRRVRRRRN